MTESVCGNTTALAAFNYNETFTKIPTFLCLTLLTPFGIVGNAGVIYVYGFRLKKTNLQHFITLLAVFDIICCLVAFPLKMVELWLPVMYPSGILCKVQNSIICFTCVASALTLLIISVDRYKKVCRPMQSQMTLRHAKILFLVISIVSLAFAVTAALIYDRQCQSLTDSEDLVGYICVMNFNSVVTQGYFLALFVILVTVLGSMLVLYCLVWREAKKHFIQSDLRHRHNDTQEEGDDHQSPQKKNLHRTNRTVVLISLLFAISFVPSLMVSVVFAHFTHVKFSVATRTVRELIYATWALNSSMNPLVYGFCNENFRTEFQNLRLPFGCYGRYTAPKKNDIQPVAQV